MPAAPHLDDEAMNFSPSPDDRRATFVEHLDELRRRIINSLFAVVVAAALGFIIEPTVYKFLAEPLLKQLPEGSKLVIRSAPEAFFLKFKISLIIGLIIAIPFVTMQLWGFLSPGLTPSERRAMRFVAPFSVFLFLFGAGMGYFTLPAAFKWFLTFLDDFAGAELYQDVAMLAMFVVKFMLAFGLGFQLPVVMMFLAKIGLATPEFMWRNWRQALVIIAFMGALLTPSGDAFSMVAIALPMGLLYFVSIGLVSRIHRQRMKRQQLQK
ncbi:MAG: twin-arginine translocase subunit TatC [Armatimonadetes bacterium]|nr:twin-arginine translocase subunit TatC [Armatimonadota bacterium]